MVAYSVSINTELHELAADHREIAQEQLQDSLTKEEQKVLQKNHLEKRLQDGTTALTYGSIWCSSTWKQTQENAKGN